MEHVAYEYVERVLAGHVSGVVGEVVDVDVVVALMLETCAVYLTWGCE